MDFFVVAVGLGGALGFAVGGFDGFGVASLGGSSHLDSVEGFLAFDDVEALSGGPVGSFDVVGGESEFAAAVGGVDVDVLQGSS